MCIFSCFSCVQLSAAPGTRVRQAPLSMGFSIQEYWGGFLCPAAGDLHNPGTEPITPVSPALQTGSLPTEQPGKPQGMYIFFLNFSWGIEKKKKNKVKNIAMVQGRVISYHTDFVFITYFPYYINFGLDFI